MNKIIIISTLLLSACVNAGAYYQYNSKKPDEKPADISGTRIHQLYSDESDGNLYITHIDGKELKELDKGNTAFIPGLNKEDSGSIAYKISPGRHVIKANLDSFRTTSITLALEADEDEHYQIKALKVQSSDLISENLWKIWVEDSVGVVVVPEMDLSLHRRPKNITRMMHPY